jgi:hypothetical protein
VTIKAPGSILGTSLPVIEWQLSGQKSTYQLGMEGLNTMAISTIIVNPRCKAARTQYTLLVTVINQEPEYFWEFETINSLDDVMMAQAFV